MAIKTDVKFFEVCNLWHVFKQKKTELVSHIILICCDMAWRADITIVDKVKKELLFSTSQFLPIKGLVKK